MPEKSDTTTTFIHIWKIDPLASPQKPYYQIHHLNTRLPSKICFLGNNICVFETYGMTQYKLKKDGTVIKLGKVRCKSIGDDEDSQYPTKKDNRNNTWRLIKNSALLYLCNQAVINTKLTDSIPSIICKITYQELWPHEQDKVKESAKTKRGIEIS